MEKPLLVETGSAVEATGLVHCVVQPSASKPSPAVVMLHGRFGNEDVMWTFSRTLPTDWLIVAPRAIMAEKSSYSWLPTGNKWPQLADFDAAVTAVSHFIYTLPQQYNANPEQIYLMGFSQGAAVSYATALNYPRLVQGIAGLVGFMPCDSAELPDATPLQDLPIFMAAGSNDATIPLELARSGAKTARIAGASLTYYEYSTGHKMNYAGLQDLKNWWIAQA